LKFFQSENTEIALPGLLESRAVSIILGAVLFATNFLLFYFIFTFTFKEELTGLPRLALCWLGAYALTWIICYLAKGTARLALTLFFIGILCFTFMFRP